MNQNVVVIVMDTAREIDVFPEDGEVAPSLTEIAEEGTRYRQAFSPAPWTLPSHGSLFTGTYPSKHGAHAGHKYLDDTVPFLPTILAEDGYETVAVSNNTWISEEFGFGRGFETFYKTWQYVQTETDFSDIAQTKEGWDRIRALVPRLVRGNPLVNVTNALYGRFGRKRNDSGARRTNQWISEWLTERSEDRPFFLFVNYLEPHLEYRPPKPFAQKFLPDNVTYEEAMEISQDAWSYVAGKTNHGEREFEILRALYRGEIAYLDHQIDDLRNALEEADEWDDTIFIVTSDHGENIGEHSLMDHQYCLYDTVLHVPLIVCGGPFSSGQDDDSLVSLIDLVPTIYDSLDLKARDFFEACQGTSLLAEEDDDRDAVFAEYLAPQPSLDALEQRVGQLPPTVEQYDRSLRAVRTANWKFIRGSDGSRKCFDMGSSEMEERDVSDEHPERAAELDKVLDDWLASFDPADASGDVSMSTETKRRLEDLGYLQE